MIRASWQTDHNVPLCALRRSAQIFISYIWTTIFIAKDAKLFIFNELTLLSRIDFEYWIQ